MVNAKFQPQSRYGFEIVDIRPTDRFHARMTFDQFHGKCADSHQLKIYGESIRSNFLQFVWSAKTRDLSAPATAGGRLREQSQRGEVNTDG
jgi:hypothetical protein